MSEVCSAVDVSQFAAGHSVDKCGFYGVALCLYAGKPGQAPTGTPLDVTRWASTEYVKYDGADTDSNFNGMVMQTLFDVVHDAALHYQLIGSNELNYHPEHMTAEYIRAWLKLGYPVVLAVAESNVYDQDLQGSPYAWNTDGLYHIIVATGIGDDNTILCHDTASIDNNGVRPGPRRYNATSLETGLTGATAIVLPWMARPPADYDPIASGGTMIPQGWHDDGMTLTAPNGHKVVHGFRAAILNASNWDAGNMPREDEQSVSLVELHNPGAGAGARQIFRDLMYIWTTKNGMHTSAAGDEIKACYDRIAAQQKQITDLQAQLNAAQTSVISAKIDMPGAVAALQIIATSTLNEVKALAALRTALGIQ